MTTKYTDEQIIAYLRTLREGDVLTAVADDGDFTAGRLYDVGVDSDGDLRIEDNYGGTHYVNIGGDFDCSLAVDFHEGIFEIPTPANAAPDSIYVSIRQIAEITSGGIPYKSVTVRVDDAGFAELEALESRSFNTRKLARLYAERAEIQAEIDALESEAAQ